MGCYLIGTHCRAGRISRKCPWTSPHALLPRGTPGKKGKKRLWKMISYSVPREFYQSEIKRHSIYIYIYLPATICSEQCYFVAWKYILVRHQVTRFSINKAQNNIDCCSDSRSHRRETVYETNCIDNSFIDPHIFDISWVSNSKSQRRTYRKSSTGTFRELHWNNFHVLHLCAETDVNNENPAYDIEERCSRLQVK